MLRRFVALLFVLALTLGTAACGGSESQGNPDRDVSGDAPLSWDTADDVQKDQPGTDTTPAPCENDLECDGKMGAAPACRRWTCDPTVGCVLADLDNGGACDDRNACTANDRCLSGGCVGDGVACDDQNPCTADTCDPTTGCHHANADGAACNDGDLCTLNDACAGGACTGAANPECVCDVDADCAQFDDGDLCNGVKICVGTTCITNPDSIVDCTDVAAGPCEVVACEAANGQCKKSPKANGAPCTDGSACTLNDACAAGECVGSALACADANPCTDDTCDPSSGCVYLANTEACDDGDLCTEDDACAEGACSGTPNPACQCTVDADCAAYDDGDLCNGTLACSAAGRCEVKAGSPVTCSPDLGGPCDEVFCEPASGDCKVKDALDGTTCDDGNACTENDVCAAGICLGDIRECLDNNVCTDNACEPATGCKFTPNTLTCDDGNGCTQNDVCVDGACVGTAEPSCQCDATADCAALEDGDLCNGTLTCEGNQCVVASASVVTCPEQTGCTQFECVPETGACIEKTAADGTACKDGNKCSPNDSCSAGQCVGAGELVCDDGNLCTDDGCDPATGCQHTYNTLGCTDGNDCTDNDTCSEGACVGTPNPECVCLADADCGKFEDADLCNGTLVCVEHKCVVDTATVVTCPADDPNGCNFHLCIAETGACELIAIPDGRPCSDADACTTGDVCKGGTCTTTGTLECGDNKLCTDDGCDAALGCVHAFNTSPCDDRDPCTSGDTCVEGVCQPGATNICPQNCSPAETISCGGSVFWSTTGPKATNEVADYPCAVAPQDGPEYAFRFDAPYEGKVRVFLTGEDSQTNLFVLKNAGAGCSPDTCQEWDFASVEFPMAVGDGYYFVVDSMAMPTGMGFFTLNVECVPTHELACNDGVDDDQDGLTDCADTTDCPLGSDACPSPDCAADWTLYCGGTDTWTNYTSGATDVVSQYTCAPGTFGGSEYAYAFVPENDGSVTLSMTANTAPLEMFVLTGGTGTCNGLNCVAHGAGTLTFEAKNGEAYYVVVDGAEGIQSAYTLSVNCVSVVETACYNKYDDDQDGKTDCADEACTDDAACKAQPCVVQQTLSCHQTVSDSTLSPAASDLILTAGCDNVIGLLDGNEMVYQFMAPYDGTLDLSLDSPTLLALMVVKATAGACDVLAAGSCLAASYIGSVLDMKAGEVYYLIVDSRADQAGTFSLGVSCTAL